MTAPVATILLCKYKRKLQAFRQWWITANLVINPVLIEYNMSVVIIESVL